METQPVTGLGQGQPQKKKQPSGAAKRKAAKAKAAAYAVAASGLPVPGVADFARLPPPPLGDPATAIAWVNDALLIALSQVLKDPALTNLDRWKWVKDFGQALGMLRDKAAEQASIKKALAGQQATQAAQGTFSAAGRTKKAIPRPPS